MHPREREVVNLYGRLWSRIGSFDAARVTRQFLENVDLPADWFRGKRCLDAGCGAGFAALAIEALGGLGVACDLDDRGLRVAAERLREAGAEPRLARANVLGLPFATGAFDFVHCNGVLHHSVAPQRGFAELVRVTKPGGTLFVSVYGKGGLYGALVGVARLVAAAVPFRLLETSVALALGGRRLPRSFMPAAVSALDNLLVPIRRSYGEDEIRGWFATAGVEGDRVLRTATTLYDHRSATSRWIHGAGYLQFRATLPESEA